MANGLVISDLSIQFGGIVALDGVSFAVGPSEIVALIGPNGAGKTTVFNCISRFYKPDRGAISFDDIDLLRTPAEDIIRRGIARTFQNLELFKTMTVLDNLLVGQTSRVHPDYRQIGILSAAAVVGAGAAAAAGGTGAVTAATAAIASGISVAGLSVIGGIHLPMKSTKPRPPNVSGQITNLKRHLRLHARPVVRRGVQAGRGESHAQVDHAGR